jgi:hypothetical protein
MQVAPTDFLLQLAAIFASIVAGILLFIAFYLEEKSRLAKTKKHLRAIYSDLISEISICETVEEKEALLAQPAFQACLKKWLSQPLGRKILIKELVRSTDSFTGDAAQNLRWLYERLSLNEDSFRRFQSGQWHAKAIGIQQLAEMHQAKYLVKIYRETNSKNEFVRTEAQIAVVKLTGFKGLRFLNIINHPVTQWQQLCLIDQLKEQEIEVDMIRTWLSSKNETVVQFALRLVEIYRCYDFHDDVVACLHHSAGIVRLQAIRAIKEIATEASFSFLWPLFSKCATQEQLLLIDLFGELATPECARFLSSLTKSSNNSLRHKATTVLQQGTFLTEPAEEKAGLPTYFLSPVQKKVV